MREHVGCRIAGFMAMMPVFLAGMYICRITLANSWAYARFSFFLSNIRITCLIVDTPVRGYEIHCNVPEPWNCI